MFAALTEKSGKNCDKGELYKTIAEKYKACMRDMVGRAPGTAMGQGGGGWKKEVCRSSMCRSRKVFPRVHASTVQHVRWERGNKGGLFS